MALQAKFTEQVVSLFDMDTADRIRKIADDEDIAIAQVMRELVDIAIDERESESKRKIERRTARQAARIA